MKLPQFIIFVFFIKSLNFLETESVALLVPDPIITPLDILYKVKKFYNEAKSVLEDRKKERERAENCSDEWCLGDMPKAVPEICAGLENDLSQCALKLFMMGQDIGAFETADWAVTAILFYKYVLEGAHSFALCSQYYDRSNNAVLFHQIKEACRDVSNYFFTIALFMNGRMINAIVRTHQKEYAMNKFAHKDYLKMPLNEFNKLFPKRIPSNKDKTIHAVKNLYEFEKYIKLLSTDKSKACLIPEEEERLKCILNRADELHPNMNTMLENLEYYLNSIHCKSTLSLNPSLLKENPSLVLKTHKIVWESLSFINRTLQTHSTDIFDQPIDIIIEIEKLKIKAVSLFNGEVVEAEPGITEAADYFAAWGKGSSKENFVWFEDE